MLSKVGICNSALAKLGDSFIIDIDDGSKQARACKECFDRLRDALLRSHRWSFAMTRLAMPALFAPTTDNASDLVVELSLDIDGDGTVTALTDGLLLQRYLFGLRGASLISGAIGVGATRTTANQIEAYIEQLLEGAATVNPPGPVTTPFTLAPAFGFRYQYLLPVDLLRLDYVGDYFVGLDMSDYRNASAAEYQIEGRILLTDLGPPLHIRFIKRITDTTQYDPLFDEALAAVMAREMAMSLAQSTQLKDLAAKDFQSVISSAVRVNAIEHAPEPLPDESWVMSRL